MDFKEIKRRAIINKQQEIVNRAKKQNRKLTAMEEMEFQTLQNEFEGLLIGKALPTPAVSVSESFGAALDFAQKHAKKESPIQNAAIGASLGVGSDGGFQAPETVASLMALAEIDDAPILSRVLTIENDSRDAVFPKIEDGRASGCRYQGVSANFIGEAEEIDISKMQFSALSVRPKAIKALFPVTEEARQDVNGLVDSITNTVVPQAFRFCEENAIINGDGITSYVGILNAPATITVSKRDGQTAKTITQENLSDMWDRLDARFLKGSIWLCNKECRPALAAIGTVIGGSGSAQFQSGVLADVNVETGEFLMGLPIVYSEHCPALGQRGDIMLVNLKQYLRRPSLINGVVSLDFLFLTYESAYRFIMRSMGMPIPAAPVVPLHSSTGATVSSFIVLAERS